jgi:hypothetical protein
VGVVVQLHTPNFGTTFMSVAGLIGIHRIGNCLRCVAGRDGQHKNSCHCSYLYAERPVHNAVTMPAKISRYQMKHCFNVGRIKTGLLFYLLLMPRGSPFSYLANSCYTGGVFQVINVCSAWKPRHSRRVRK